MFKEKYIVLLPGFVIEFKKNVQRKIHSFATPICYGISQEMYKESTMIYYQDLQWNLTKNVHKNYKH